MGETYFSPEYLLIFSFSLWTVGTPMYTAIRLSYSSRSRCNSLGGGGLGTQMNLFDRFARVVKVVYILKILVIIIGNEMLLTVFQLYLSVVVCKCYHRLIWGSWEDTGTNCYRDERWFDQVAPSYSTSMSCDDCLFTLHFLSSKVINPFRTITYYHVCGFSLLGWAGVWDGELILKL